MLFINGMELGTSGALSESLNDKKNRDDSFVKKSALSINLSRLSHTVLVLCGSETSAQV